MRRTFQDRIGLLLRGFAVVAGAAVAAAVYGRGGGAGPALLAGAAALVASYAMGHLALRRYARALERAQRDAPDPPPPPPRRRGPPPRSRRVLTDPPPED